MEKLESFVKTCGLRKFGLAVCWIIVTGYLLLHGVLPSGDYMAIQKILILAVFGSNVAEHITNKVKNGGETNGEDKSKPVSG